MLPEIVSRDEWSDARRRLLSKERELMERSDEINAERRRMPMVEVDPGYPFEGERGTATLLDLFADRHQLIVYHFMFGESWDAGCPGCTAVIDGLSEGQRRHLQSRDTSLAVVSRAPLAKLLDYRARRGWSIDWYSSLGSSFNFDFGVTLDASVAPIVVNYREGDALRSHPDGWVLDPANQPVEISGVSCFLREHDRVFHTYSAYRRGTEPLIPAYRWLDLTPLGRQEGWEQPSDRVAEPRAADPTFGG